MKTLILIIIIASLLIFTIACSRNLSTNPETITVRALTQNETKITFASEQFGFKLLAEINKNENDNIFISPLSVSMALGMTLNGAANETETAIRTTLGFGNMKTENINASYASLIKLLSDIDPKVQFDIANSIWYRLGFKVEPEFIDTNKKYFDAEIRELDFASSLAPQKINNWVDEQTHGKIEKIVEEIKPETVMFLINAIYFNGTWSYEFDKNKTTDDYFYLADNNKIPCKLMIQSTDQFSYFADDNLQVIDLPYGNGQFRMTILLPKGGNNVNELIANLTSQNWSTYMASFKKQRGTLYLPKFKLEYKKSLIDVLANMGMGISFTSAADFTNINKQGNLFISDVQHKTFVDVYEEGTEAAAVTMVEISLTSTQGQDPGFLMRVDRPFLFFIREMASSAILFAGKIVNPEAGK